MNRSRQHELVVETLCDIARSQQCLPPALEDWAKALLDAMDIIDAHFTAGPAVNVSAADEPRLSERVRSIVIDVIKAEARAGGWLAR